MPRQNGQNENCRLVSAPSSVVGKYDPDMYQCPLLTQSGRRYLAGQPFPGVGLSRYDALS